MSRLLYRFITLSILSAALGGSWLWNDYRLYLQTPMNDQPLNYTLEPGANLTQVVRDLAGQGLIIKPRYLLFYARLQGNANHIGTGEYRIKTGTTPAEFYQQLVAGKVRQHALTIVEGWSFRQMMDALNAHPQIKHTLAQATDAEIMAAINHVDEHPEGRFLPDTWHFPRGMSDVDFLRRAYAAMQIYLVQEWATRAVDLPLKTPYEALILASIVEKETGLASERPTIAGVFTRRLQKRIRLQTDPTVIYGMGARYKGNIRRSDLKRDTPYNTYRHHGLPPTPIALPGRAAIHAALHPESGKALYFVSRGDGSHYFSATLEEHNRAVIKYQLKGRKRSFSSYKSKDKK
ncbi:FIG004453: protein YceG like [hydrothermal vent metagenome]|uniref:FIG004453: protein YceG like n=1 Tax=hydrothermal vent metagenome TaxID=652676 RepID=A0A3B1AUZ9_9ZZZZ